MNAPRPALRLPGSQRPSFVARLVAAGLFGGLAVGPTVPFASADRFELRTGGVLEGKIVAEEPDGNDRMLTIELENGGTIRLKRTQIQRIVEPTPAELEYRERVVGIEETVEAHWNMALWCEENGLRSQQDHHLMKVIDLDPEHAEARRKLKYFKQGGDWLTREQLMRRRGVRPDGMLVEEYEFKRVRDEFDRRTTEFKRELPRWRNQIGKARHAESIAAIEGIRDPAAVGPVVDMLKREETRDGKLLWINVLARIEGEAPIRPLVDVALSEEDEYLREIALKSLRDRNDPNIQRLFMGQLDPSRNPPVIINRAGAALGFLKSSEAIRSMIEALVTKHKVANPAAGQNGRTGAGFDNAGGFSGNFGSGNQPAMIEMPSQNGGVLTGLRDITGVDWGYDKDRWLQWFASQRTPAGYFDLRRDQ